MSEAAGTGAVRQGGGGLPYSQRVALVLFAIALSGPLIGMMAGKSPGLVGRFLEGWYSLPIAIFGDYPEDLGGTPPDLPWQGSARDEAGIRQFIAAAARAEPKR